MKSQKQSILSAASFLLAASWAIGQAPTLWVFEGLITESDPVLAPDLQSGWVLSGSFLLDGLQMEEQFVDEDARSGRIVGGITEVELTVDLYHQVLFEAFQAKGLTGLDFQNNNLEEDGRDLLGWFFPMDGQLGSTGWNSSWLQIWLMDPGGEMIRQSPVQISPFGVNWKSGWFRITYVNEVGDTAFTDGRIEIFSPESELDENTASPWQSIAGDLSRQLLERDSMIKLLQKETDELKQRIEGLRKMVDLLVEERSSLQEDNELLREQAAAADPEAVKKIAELNAEKTLLEANLNELSGRNASLEDELQRSEGKRIDLESELEKLEIRISNTKQSILNENVQITEPAVQEKSFQPVYPLPGKEVPADVTETEEPSSQPELEQNAEQTAEPSAAESNKKHPVKRGPRKFR